MNTVWGLLVKCSFEALGQFRMTHCRGNCPNNKQTIIPVSETFGPTVSQSILEDYLFFGNWRSGLSQGVVGPGLQEPEVQSSTMRHPMSTVSVYLRTRSNQEVLQYSTHCLPMVRGTLCGFDLSYAPCFDCKVNTYR